MALSKSSNWLYKITIHIIFLVKVKTFATLLTDTERITTLAETSLYSQLPKIRKGNPSADISALLLQVISLTVKHIFFNALLTTFCHLSENYPMASISSGQSEYNDDSAKNITKDISS